jgi:predicted metalloprotease with PDZ domain
VFYNRIGSNVDRVLAVPARLEVSPYESSYRVGEAANGRGNSNGYKISYYDLGWLCGMLLDIEIRSQTNGAHSLDDVEHALWNECKNNQPGFQEDEIRRLCVRFGGAALGRFYDQVVMHAGELPVNAELAKVGLTSELVDTPFVDYGFTYTPSRDQGGAVVNTVKGPAEGQLKVGDVIVSINGKAYDPANGRGFGQAMSTELSKAQAGVPVNIIVKRDGQNMDVQVTPVNSTKKTTKVSEVPNATPQQIALRDGWLATKKPRM